MAHDIITMINVFLVKKDEYNEFKRNISTFRVNVMNAITALKEAESNGAPREEIESKKARYEELYRPLRENNLLQLHFLVSLLNDIGEGNREAMEIIKQELVYCTSSTNATTQYYREARLTTLLMQLTQVLESEGLSVSEWKVLEKAGRNVMRYARTVDARTIRDISLWRELRQAFKDIRRTSVRNEDTYTKIQDCVATIDRIEQKYINVLPDIRAREMNRMFARPDFQDDQNTGKMVRYIEGFLRVAERSEKEDRQGWQDWKDAYTQALNDRERGKRYLEGTLGSTLTTLKTSLESRKSNLDTESVDVPLMNDTELANVQLLQREINRILRDPKIRINDDAIKVRLTEISDHLGAIADKYNERKEQRRVNAEAAAATSGTNTGQTGGAGYSAAETAAIVMGIISLVGLVSLGAWLVVRRRNNIRKKLTEKMEDLDKSVKSNDRTERRNSDEKIKEVGQIFSDALQGRKNLLIDRTDHLGSIRRACKWTRDKLKWIYITAEDATKFLEDTRDLFLDVDLLDSPDTEDLSVYVGIKSRLAGFLNGVYSEYGETVKIKGNTLANILVDEVFITSFDGILESEENERLNEAISYVISLGYLVETPSTRPGQGSTLPYGVPDEQEAREDQAPGLANNIG